MRLLTAVIKDEEVQQYISENEDSAFEFLKENFKVEDIYNYVVEHINLFLSDNLEVSYENIKAAARDYVLRVLSEGTSEVPTIDPVSSQVMSKVNVSSAKNALESGDQESIVKMAERIAGQIGDSANVVVDSTTAYVKSLSADANNMWHETIVPAMTENPNIASAIALVGVVGLGGTLVKMRKNSKSSMQHGKK